MKTGLTNEGEANRFGIRQGEIGISCHRFLRGSNAFTLVELLVVIGIIALLATLGMGALKGFNAVNVVKAGNRQLLDDINMARNHALNQRQTVYMVFVPPLFGFNVSSLTNPAQQKQFTNRIVGQFTSYNFVTLHAPGDQPGSKTPHFLSEWKTLPEGVYIDTNKFVPYDFSKPAMWMAMTSTNRPFPRFQIPFPTSGSVRTNYLPCLAFNYRGELLGPDLNTPRRGDEYISLTRGSMAFEKQNGAYTLARPETIETPKGNTTNNPYIRVDWLTGRARIEEPKS